MTNEEYIFKMYLMIIDYSNKEAADYYLNAVENASHLSVNKRVNVGSIFTWDLSPQGYAFWNNIHNYISSNWSSFKLVTSKGNKYTI